ncbi:MAG: adenosylcobinamide-GDP ribazoletransferase [Actinomycetota bacterium]|nr:adenosylcobinamide-GDP ribazoletransferase [Actinomycetota bacterium]
MSVIDDIREAFAMLTVLPDAGDPTRRTGTGAAGWFPVVGFVLGGTTLGALAVVNSASVAWGDGELLERGALVFAVCVVAGWALVTRFLHWDGLADVADGYWGGHDIGRRLEIMADSATGAFGAIAVTLVAIAQVAAIATILGRPTGAGMVILGAPVMGRMAATFASWLGKPARPDGLGSRVMGMSTASGGIAAGAAVTVALAVCTWQWGLVALAWGGASLLAALVIPHLISKRFGGVTGDVMGASILLVETFSLVLAALIGSW